MDVIQDSSQIISENLEVISREPDDLENHENNERGKFADFTRRSRYYLLGPTFVAGLLLGWIVIGWWLWPVQWTNSDPWQLRPKHQRTLVRLVAEDFGGTGDVSRAQEDLAGWDKEALAELLATMENEASSSEERRRLAALAEALEMPDVKESFVTSLLGQKAILLSSILSVSLLVGAITLAVSPLVQTRTRRGEGLLAEGEQLEEAFEELLTREEEQAKQQDQAGEQQDREQEEQQAGEEDEEERAEEEEEDDEEDDEKEEDTPWVQDLVSDLLDEEDTSLPQLKTLCKKLPDIDASGLLDLSQKVANDLRKSNSPRYG
jgi:hypothetical protein